MTSGAGRSLASPLATIRPAFSGPRWLWYRQNPASVKVNAQASPGAIGVVASNSGRTWWVGWMLEAGQKSLSDWLTNLTCWPTSISSRSGSNPAPVYATAGAEGSTTSGVRLFEAPGPAVVEQLAAMRTVPTVTSTTRGAPTFRMYFERFQVGFTAVSWGLGRPRRQSGPWLEYDHGTDPSNEREDAGLGPGLGDGDDPHADARLDGKADDAAGGQLSAFDLGDLHRLDQLRSTRLDKEFQMGVAYRPDPREYALFEGVRVSSADYSLTFVADLLTLAEEAEYLLVGRLGQEGAKRVEDDSVVFDIDSICLNRSSEVVSFV